MPAAIRIRTTPWSFGRESSRAIHPWRSQTTTSSTATTASRMRWTFLAHRCTRSGWPMARRAVTRRTTPTRTAEPGIDRMKNRPSSWAMAP